MSFFSRTGQNLLSAVDGDQEEVRSMIRYNTVTVIAQLKKVLSDILCIYVNSVAQCCTFFELLQTFMT